MRSGSGCLGARRSQLASELESRVCAVRAGVAHLVEPKDATIAQGVFYDLHGRHILGGQLLHCLGELNLCKERVRTVEGGTEGVGGAVMGSQVKRLTG